MTRCPARQRAHSSSLKEIGANPVVRGRKLPTRPARPPIAAPPCLAQDRRGRCAADRSLRSSLQGIGANPVVRGRKLPTRPARPPIATPPCLAQDRRGRCAADRELTPPRYMAHCGLCSEGRKPRRGPQGRQSPAAQRFNTALHPLLNRHRFPGRRGYLSAGFRR